MNNEQVTYVAKLAITQKESYLHAHAFFEAPNLERHFTAMVKSFASLQSWLEYFFVPQSYPDQVRSFYIEAVNDAIVSYSLARVGTWRPALQCLRSTLENCLVFLYYKDHPVEVKLWSMQKHRISFSELCTYLKSHPLLTGFDHQSETGIVVLEEVYAELSRAVHGSANFMRMTAKSASEELPSMHVESPIELSRFATLARRLSGYLNLLFVGMFRESLSGTSLPLLRDSIGGAMAEGQRRVAKSAFGVTLHK